MTMGRRAYGRVPLASAALVVALVLLPVVAVLARAGGGALKPADAAALWFTLWQAALSAALSVALAIPVARALARRRFFGRAAVITVLGVPFVLPVIVAVLGLIAVFGRHGIVSDLMVGLGFEPISIYGLHGVIIAHVFFNLPLATRLILHGWLAIPAERLRLAQVLGFSPGLTLRVIEIPMLRQILPGAWLAIFLICSTSFAVALTLGGGPRATTVELAIYQALRFDFDLGRAALLALVQVVICSGAALVAWRLSGASALAGGLDRMLPIRAPGGALRVMDALWIAAAALFLMVPLGAVLASGVAGLGALTPATAAAAMRSVAVALGSTVLAVALSLSVALGRGPVQAMAGAVPLAVSPLVLGTGLFLLLRGVANPADLALPVTAVVNALLVLPFGLRALIPAVQQVEAAFGRQADLLGLYGRRRFWIVTLPRIRRPLGFVAGLSAALSMGDLGVVTLFASQDQETLPLHMYRLMGSYRGDAAAAAALVLVALTLALFWIFDRGGRSDA